MSIVVADIVVVVVDVSVAVVLISWIVVGQLYHVTVGARVTRKLKLKEAQKTTKGTTTTTKQQQHRQTLTSTTASLGRSRFYICILSLTSLFLSSKSSLSAVQDGYARCSILPTSTRLCRLLEPGAAGTYTIITTYLSELLAAAY